MSVELYILVCFKIQSCLLTPQEIKTKKQPNERQSKPSKVSSHTIGGPIVSLNGVVGGIWSIYNYIGMRPVKNTPVKSNLCSSSISKETLA